MPTGLLGQIKEIVGQTTVPQVRALLSQALQHREGLHADAQPDLQVFVGGEFIGGSEEALKLLDEGELLHKGKEGESGLPDKLRSAVDKAAQDFEVSCVLHTGWISLPWL